MIDLEIECLTPIDNIWREEHSAVARRRLTAILALKAHPQPDIIGHLVSE